MVNDNESKILNVKLTQEKIKSIVNVTYSQPVSYFRKNIKLEMDILKPNREGNIRQYYLCREDLLHIAIRKIICNKDWK